MIKCWGMNTVGQLGDGTIYDRSSPVEVVGITDAIAVAAGYYVSCAVLANEEARCWGSNGYGQLGDGSTTVGDGSTTDSSIPVSTIYLSAMDFLMNVGTPDTWTNGVRVGDGRVIMCPVNADYVWIFHPQTDTCLLYTSPSPRDLSTSRMPSSA